MKPDRDRRLIAALALALFAALFCGIGRLAAFQGEPQGFDGFAWGAAREDLGSMTYVRTDCAGDALYEKQGGAPHYGRARLAAIEYGFRDGRLTGVTLRVNSLFQYLLMKEEARKRYGEGDELAGRKDSYVWSGENTRILLVSRFADS